MDPRPAHLPDFESPPIREVVLGIQFAELKAFTTIHAGLFWSRIRDKFNKYQEVDPLPQAFELFGGVEQRTAQSPRIEVLKTLPLPRYWFIDKNESELIQLQRDKFFHNWRRTGQGDDYPHYEKIRDSFKTSVRLLEDFIAQEGIGTIECNQCEVSYINHIPLIADERFGDAINRVFGHWCRLGGMAPPILENATFVLNHILEGSEGPIGRLRVTIQPAHLADGMPLFIMDLTARGRPLSNDGEGYFRFMAQAREAIVTKFTELTSEQMHETWRRFQ